jgi:hypothetical protein
MFEIMRDDVHRVARSLNVHLTDREEILVDAILLAVDKVIFTMLCRHVETGHANKREPAHTGETDDRAES